MKEGNRNQTKRTTTKNLKFTVPYVNSIKRKQPFEWK